MGSDGELLAEDLEYRSFFERSRWKSGQFYRVIEGSPKVWKRFALLPFFNGGKYTIGDSFISREEQGEYIFWCRDDKEPQQLYNSSNGDRFRDFELPPPRQRIGSICEIQVGDNKFWLTPLGEFQIGINDTQIKDRSELKFGDYLVFGRPSEANKERNVTGSLIYPNVLWFCKRELNSEAFLTKKDDFKAETGKCQLLLMAFIGWMCFRRIFKSIVNQEREQVECTNHALGNDLILSKILSFFPCSELKTFRLVSRLWDQEGKRLIKKKGRVTFSFNNGWWRDHWDRANDSMQFLRYSLEMGDTPMPNWTINLSAFPPIMADGPESKLLSDMSWFFSREPSHPVKRLKLRGEICSKLDLDVRMKILEGLQSTLEELELHEYWHIDTKLPNQGGSSHLLFKKLQHFRIRIEAHPALAQIFIPLVTRVKALSLPGGIFDQQLFLDNLGSFSNLQEIRFDTMKPVGIKALLQFVKKGLQLKKMDLGQLENMTEEGISDFNALLSTHAPSLEGLGFILPQRLKSTLRIQFPVLPKLKKLDFGLPCDTYRNSQHELSISFEGEPINYVKHLPVLQSLSIWPCGHTFNPSFRVGQLEVRDISRFCNEYAQLLNIFFPDHSHGGSFKMCKTLRELDIPFRASGGNFPKRRNILFKRAPELARVFPNVDNEWTTEARAVPYWPPTPEEIEEKRQIRLRVGRELAKVGIGIDELDW